MVIYELGDFSKASCVLVFFEEEEERKVNIPQGLHSLSEAVTTCDSSKFLGDRHVLPAWGELPLITIIGREGRYEQVPPAFPLNGPPTPPLPTSRRR